MEISANREIEKQRIEADMRTQISHIEAMEIREAEFVIEKANEKELAVSEMQGCMLLERELAEEKQKNLRLEFEVKTRRLEMELREKGYLLSKSPSLWKLLILYRTGIWRPTFPNLPGPYRVEACLTSPPQVFRGCRGC